MSRDRSAQLGLENFRFSLYDDGVAVATLDVPGETHNALSSSLIAELETILAACEEDTGIRALVLASGKPKSFVVGADIKELNDVKTVVDATELSKRSHSLMDRLEGLYLNFDKPVVAAIHGPALGGGLEVALACTLRVCSDSDETTLGLPEVQLGLIPGAGGTQRAPKLVGISNALDMILTGRNIRPRKALDMGLVDEVCPAAIVVEVACGLALKSANGELSKPKAAVDRIAELAQEVTDAEFLQQLALEENPVGQRILFRKAREKLLEKTKGNYPAPEAALDAVRIGVQEGPEAGYAAEADRFGRLVMSPESAALRSIFFAQTALKKDSGVDGDAVPRPVGQIGVLGGGLMGGGIAYVSVAKAKVPARIKEVNDAGMRRGLAYVRRVLDKGVQRRRLSAFEADRMMQTVTATTEWQGFGTADIVIEAVFEDLELKREMVRLVEAHGHENTIFASNTSSIPIAEIASAAAHPERVIGMHYFSPVEKMPLLEIIVTEQTADWVTATCVAAGKAQGKTVIVVRDGTGFYTSRILAPYMNEAAWLFAEGAPLGLLDEALVEFGFPVGPITLLDEVGIDVGAKVAKIMHREFGDRLLAPSAMQALIDDGRQGRKNGRGFFLYENGRKKGLDESVYALVGSAKKGASVSKEDVQERLALQMVNEAARCLEEGILRSARDGDVGAVFGLGFPPFLGGPFSYVDRFGAKDVVERLRRLEQRHGERFAPAQVLVSHAESGQRFR